MIARTAISVILLLVVTALPAAAEKRVALVIGNDDYATLPDLNNARKDARDMASKLEDLDFEVILKLNASERETVRAMVEFERRLSRGDVGLVFFAGHGVQAGGRNWLIPSDAEVEIEDDLHAEAIDTSDFLLRMEQAGAPINIVILDACRDNPLPKRTRSAARGLSVSAMSQVKGIGTAILLAAGQGEAAIDGPAGGNGVFTGELLKALDRPGLTIEDVFRQTVGAVRQITGGKQNPVMINASMAESFYFRPGGGDESQSAAKAGTDRTEVASLSPSGYDRDTVFWESIKDSDDIEDFRAYLQQFPNGVYVYLAEKRIRELSQPAFEVASLDQTMWVAGSGAVNVRGGPTTKSEKIGRFSGLAEVNVTGRVEGLNWYRVGLSEGRTGFVFGDLLTEDDPAPDDGGGQVASLSPSGSDAEEAFYRRIEDSRDIEDFREYLRLFPDGVNAYFARKRIEDLTPPDLPADLSPGDIFRDCGDTVVASGEALPSGVFCGPEMVVIPSGSFMMGSNDNEADDESPVHRVSIDYSFAVGKYEVTQSEWDSLMRINRSNFSGGDRPVESVSWNEALEFISKLNERTGQNYRLLSEAEWEYVARAGTRTKYSWGNSIGSGNAHCDDCGSRWNGRGTAPVGTFKPNGFGLYDVYGNVSEWVADCYDKNAYETHQSYPEMVGSWHDSCFRVVRGGYYGDIPKDLRSASRSRYSSMRYYHVGFRLARTDVQTWDDIPVNVIQGANLKRVGSRRNLKVPPVSNAPRVFCYNCSELTE